MLKLCPCPYELATSGIFTKDVVFLVKYFCNDPPCILDSDFNLNGILMILIKRSFLGVAFVTSLASHANVLRGSSRVPYPTFVGEE